MNAHQISRALNLRPAGQGGYTGTCPACGYRDGFTVREPSQRGALPLIACHGGRCEFAELATALHRLGLWPYSGKNGGKCRSRSRSRQALASQPEGDAAAVARREAAAMRIWHRDAGPVPGTLGEAYLRQARGYGGRLPEPSVLRFAMCWHRETGRLHPALVAAITIAGRLDEAIGVHRTFLADDGRGKAAVKKPKMTLCTVEGGSIPLFPAVAGQPLLIAEGVENALSVSQVLGWPAWSAVASGNLPALILPDFVRDVVIAADRDDDNDKLGQRKAHDAAQRWATAGRRVRVILPPQERGDWNDILRGAA